MSGWAIYLQPNANEIKRTWRKNVSLNLPRCKGKEGGSSFTLTSFFYFIFKYDCFKFGVLVEIRHLTVRFLIPPPPNPLMLILDVLEGFSLHIMWQYWSILSHIISQWALFRLVVDHWDHCRTCQYFSGFKCSNSKENESVVQKSVRVLTLSLQNYS